MSGGEVVRLSDAAPWPAEITFDKHYLDLKKQCFELIWAETLESFEP